MRRISTLIVLAGILVGIGVRVLRLGTLPKVQAQDACTNASFRGAFGYTFTGSVTNGPSLGLFAAAGRLVADGQGNFSGAETDSVDGEILQRNYTGSYQVNSDCRGSATSNDNFGTTIHCDFVIVSGGREIEFVEADFGTVIVGQLKQQ